MSRDLNLSPAEFKILVEKAHHADFDVASIAHAPAGSTVTFTKDGATFKGAFLCAAHPEDAFNADGSPRLVIHQSPADSEQNAKFTVFGLFSETQVFTDEALAEAYYTATPGASFTSYGPVSAPFPIITPISAGILAADPAYTVLDVIEVMGDVAAQDIDCQF